VQERTQPENLRGNSALIEAYSKSLARKRKKAEVAARSGVSEGKRASLESNRSTLLVAQTEIMAFRERERGSPVSFYHHKFGRGQKAAVQASAGRDCPRPFFANHT
jgi:hypothetical protein